MSKIICATRAGEGSRAVQLAAIQKAKDSGRQLVFLYVIESEPLNSLEESMQPFLRAELCWLAKTMLRIAERRALLAGINAELLVWEGNLQSEIVRLVSSSDVCCLFLGAPRRRSIDAFGHDEIESFARSIEESTGIQVEIVRPEDDFQDDKALAHRADG